MSSVIKDGSDEEGLDEDGPHAIHTTEELTNELGLILNKKE